ncbi:sigma-70 family RNA polymerase sigma factor [Rhodopirellula baltica]|uniref:RNA polymerase sigma factor n=1 Tax=Rhodopirellula baltica SWK14 TaxID=993516 RepID=L7CAW6_RHOBT|nr:sigma-70 family RNA polymerase sigma factor [Rhodopirellula baltica]ELP31349.1 RNA polymerase sigma-70 ECF-like, Rhodopirellula baltica [Rhodopirellula baltica SWK14]
MQRKEFAKLVLEHQAQLRMFVRMLGAMPDAVDDLAQDAFVVAYERIDTLDDMDNAGPWLRSIARNLVRNELRKSSRRRRVVNASLSEAMLAMSDEPVTGPWSEDWFTALRACVDRLPGHGRALVNGRYTRGQNATQLANETEMTPVAVRQALSRLRGLLRNCVESRLAEAST